MGRSAQRVQPLGVAARYGTGPSPIGVIVRRRRTKLVLVAVCAVTALAATACNSRGTTVIDSAEIVPGGILVRGWSVEVNDVKGAMTPLVKVRVGDVTASTHAGLPRPDVAAVHPTYGPSTGFQILVPHPDPASVTEVCATADVVGGTILSNDGSCVAPTVPVRPARCEVAAADSVDLSDCDLRHRGFAGTTLTRARLDRADLAAVDLRNANLGGAHLDGANLRGADLRGANLHQTFLSGTDLTGADLTGAQFVQDALFQNTTCPDGQNSDVLARCGY
jgi:Pentapeptide repeats (8 copies)